MNISTNSSVYNVYYGRNYTKYTAPQFKAKTVSEIAKPRKVKKILPKLLAVLLPLSILKCASNIESRVDGNFQGENYRVEFFDVKSGTKNHIVSSLKDFEEKATNIDFLDGTTIDITNEHEDLDNGDAFRRYLKQQGYAPTVHGSSFYSDGVISKKICVQEAAHDDNKINGSSLESIDFTLMHELGHQFDKYYGHDRNADFVKERETMLARYAGQDSLSIYKLPTNEKDLETEINYLQNSGMSDKTNFQDAFLKDLKDIAEIKKQGTGKLARNIDYFIKKVNFNKEINEKVVSNLDGTRSEVYANLFSYAVGKNDGDKETFTQNFKYSYEVVKKDVSEKIGIQ